jgi:membrane protease subunit HflK
MRGSRVGSWLILIVMVLVAYFASGLYSIRSGQTALVLRFGEVVKQVAESGIHYHLPAPFEKVLKVNVSAVQKVVTQEAGSAESGGFPHGELFREYFTGDENLILVNAVINYDVKDAAHYLFQQADVKSIIQSAGQMCLSRELAKMTVDDVMTTGKSLLRLVMKDDVQAVLDNLQTGVRVISVDLTGISPPSSVSMTFKAVSDAREKKQGIIKEAEGYANSIIPKARGQASTITNRAQACAEETAKASQARAERFDALLTEYQRSPETTAKLRYLETMQKVFETCQVKIDENPAQSTYYIMKKSQD